jgi:signal transduction histidine kinase/CheY-like chemotaxis protein
MPKSIKTHLLQILCLGIFPVGIFAAGLLYLVWSTQQESRMQAQIKGAQSLAMLVEGHIGGIARRLEVLCMLPMDTDAQRRELYNYARRVVAASPDIQNFSLSDAEGHQLFNLYEPYGKPLPNTSVLDHQKRAVGTAQPALSDSFVSLVLGRRIVGLSMPVIRDGKVAYVMAAGVRTEALGSIVRGRLLEGARVAVWDRNLVAVAATREENVVNRAPPSPEFLDAMRRQDEGVLTYRAPDGEMATTAWARTSFGWRVSLRLPASAGQTLIARYLGMLAAGWLLLLAIGAWLALQKARKVSASLGSLERQAAGLAEPPAGDAPPVASGVIEIDRAGAALGRARLELAQARRERELAFKHETQAREEAEQANRAKDRFLAMLGHELRNPLAAISNAAQVLSFGRTGPEQREFATGVISRQTRTLKRLVDDLLDVARVMAGKVKLDLRPLQLDQAATTIIEEMRAAGRFGSHEVRLEVSPARIKADATRIEQLVTNLLSNALTHTPAGGSIRVGVASMNGRAVLSVADSGPGIGAADRERIFELFYQGEQPSDRPNSGLGIGLTLVKHLAEMHGGEVTLGDSAAGAHFIVSLPLLHDAAAGDARGASDVRAAVSNGGIDVLVIEDNHDARESICMLLGLLGHRVRAAGNAEQAMRLAQGTEPELLLIDIGLPGMDGYALCRALRSRLPGAYFVALSGYGLEEDIRQAREAGFDRHLVKPADPAELQAVIAAARDRSAAAAAPRA